MKKIIVMLFVFSLFFIANAMPVMAAGAAAFGGGGVVLVPAGGSTTGSSTSINTSNNVYIMYVDSNTGQNYAATTKSNAGDRVYGTGGGSGAATNIYYQAGQTIGAQNSTDPTPFLTGNTAGWSAQ